MFGKEISARNLKDSSQISFLVENNSCLLIDCDATQIALLLESSGYAKNYRIGLVLEAFVSDSETVEGGVKRSTAAEILAEMLQDPLLMKYSALVLEINLMEIHLSILLSLLKKIIKKRKEFRIILVYKNANQIDDIIKFFGPSVQAMQINSKRFQVQEFFLETPTSDYVAEAVETVLKINDEEGPGDIFLLVPGREDVDTVISLVNERSVESRMAIQCFGIYDNSSKEQIQMAKEPSQSKTRKLIISTSKGQYIKLDCIVFVVDSGFEILNVFNHKKNIEEQVVTPISKNTALYRLEIAGLLRPGRCFRLYTKNGKDTGLLVRDILEIERCSLTRPLLILKSLGVENLTTFDYITPPSAMIMKSSLENLYKIGAINSQGELTRQGQFMVEIPYLDLNLASFVIFISDK
jgi:HrpA-like RNA helicase